MPQIRVHERALAHLSRGLYRSPASALRELVSNAWDANATRVEIDTNHPNFYQLSIVDNGDGFTRDDFEALMGGGVGNSTKRTQPPSLRWGRQPIGRLGIGMLGIAQICGAFTVTSRPRSGAGFRARVTLYDLAKSKWDEADSELIHKEMRRVDGEEIADTIVDVGSYDYEEFDQDDYEYGTRIFVDDIIPEFTQAFQESLRFEGFNEVPREWFRAVTTILTSAASLQALGDYWRLLWELAVACPLPYLADDALPNGVAKALNVRLKSCNFAVTVDGRQLFKPVYLKDNEGGYTTASIKEQTEFAYSIPVRFNGYIAVQEGTQLKPDELRGILVRIKNVGIGYYDPSMLDYPINQGPRSRWVTGEIFVEQGLEDALNIDRDSFNRFHPEFRVLQKAVHEVLRRDIFPEVYRNIKIRSQNKREDNAETRKGVLVSVLDEGSDRPVSLEETDALRILFGDEDYSSSRQDGDTIVIQVPGPTALPTKKSARQLAQSILAIFELASLTDDADARRQKFTELLFALLKRW